MEVPVKSISSTNSRFLLAVQGIFLLGSLLVHVLNIVDEHLFSCSALECYLLFTFLYICLVSVRRYSLTSAFNLFLFGYFMFQVSVLFVAFDTIAERKLMQVDFVFSDMVIKNTLCANALILNSIFIGVLCSGPRRRTSCSECRMQHSPKLEEWGRGIFLLSLPLTLLKYYLEIKFILSQGYYAYYTSALSIPIVISVSRVFFEFGYFLFIASLPDVDRFKKYSKIYLLVISLFFFVGVRNRVILSFLFVLWFYYRFYTRKSPKLLLMSILGVAGVLLLLLVQYVRQSGVFVMSDERSLLGYFLYAQSTNFYILPLMQYFDLHSDVPYVFAPLININEGGYLPDNPSNLLGNAVAYHISPEGFANGHGLGSSFIAELYDLGLGGLTIVPIVLGYAIGWFERNVSRSRVLLVISFYVITNCIYISRSSLLRNFYMIFVLLIFADILLRVKYPFKKAHV